MSTSKKEEEIMEEVEKQVEAQVTKAVTTGTTILIQVVIIFSITVVVLKFLWAWVVPDLFPGAVTQGLISANLTWSTTLKFALLVSVLTGVNDALKDAFKQQN